MDTNQVVFLLLDLAIIVVAARLAGAVASRLAQPRVIGEVLAGILLGPSLLGNVSGILFPDDVRPMLEALANIGIVLFMFIVGSEVDRRLLRGQGPAAATISSCSIILPLVLGSCLGLLLIRQHPHDNRLGFVLFVGVAMSITAFPVLARILTDLRMRDSKVGALALTCAAIDDVLAWSLLAVVVAIVGSSGDDVWRTLLFVPYVILMLTLVRPAVRKLAGGAEGTPTGWVVVLTGMLVSSAITEWMGLHLIFGAFLFGVVMPLDGWVRTGFQREIGKLVDLLLLPVFFLAAGLKVDLSAIGWVGLAELGLVLAVAITGKFAGAYVGGRATGVEPREAAALGALLNTRGLTELVVLSVGLQLGVLDGNLYSIMVVMAVVTTAIAGPLLRIISARQPAAVTTATG